MTKPSSDVAFSSSVKSVQERVGSTSQYAGPRATLVASALLILVETRRRPA